VKPRTVAVLAIVVAALGAFLWFVDRDLPSSEERAEEGKKILPIDPMDVDRVTVEWQGRTVRMEKGAPTPGGEAGEAGESDEEGTAEGGEAPSSSKTWRIVEPLQARADGSQVDRLLEALSALERTRTIEDADPAAVGLDAPRGEVTLRLAATDGETGAERMLRVGAPVPTSDGVLVSVGSGDGPATTYVTSGSFLSQLQRDPGDWRDRDVFTATRNAIERLTLSTGMTGSAGSTSGEAGPVVLARRDRQFRIEQPLSDVADPDRVDDLLSGLTTLRVDRFLDAPADSDLAQMGLDPPRQTLRANLEGGETFRIDLGGPAPEQGSSSDAGAGAGKATVYARVGDQVFTTATDLPETLGLAVSAWRSPDWTSIESFRIERLDVTRGGASFSLRRDGVDWMRDADTIPYSTASGLLSAVTGAEGEVVDRAAPATAQLTIKVTPQEGDPVTLTLFPAAADGAHLAGSSQRTALVRLPKETASGLLDAVSAVRNAKPVESAEPEKSADGIPAKEDASADS
jgi:hypothetical protein